MGKSLKQLDASKLLKLHKGPWGGSFSGMDEFHTGDESELTFLHADGGNSEYDERNIILFARYKHNEVSERIYNLDHSLNKHIILETLNAHAGIKVSDLYGLEINI